MVFARKHWSLLRLIMAERDRFPKIASAYLEIGPQRSRQHLAAYLRGLEADGRLTLAEPEKSAEFFIGMLMHEWYLRYLYSSERLPTREEKRNRAEHVVRHFLETCDPGERIK